MTSERAAIPARRGGLPCEDWQTRMNFFLLHFLTKPKTKQAGYDRTNYNKEFSAGFFLSLSN